AEIGIVRDMAGGNGAEAAGLRTADAQNAVLDCEVGTERRVIGLHEKERLGVVIDHFKARVNESRIYGGEITVIDRVANRGVYPVSGVDCQSGIDDPARK